MASSTSTVATGAPLCLLSSSCARLSNPILPHPHRLTLYCLISFQRLIVRSAASPSPSTTSLSPSGSSPVDLSQLPPVLRNIVSLFQSILDARTQATAAAASSSSTDSDAQLTKGLAALLGLGLSDAPTADVAKVPVEFIELLGIRQSLSPFRSRGGSKMIFASGQNRFLLAGSAPGSNSLSAQMVFVLVGVHPPVQFQFALAGV
uniref:Fe-S metabolism associated domain-containing protein n=1 Tax=Setaria italica TaxID=4555 RepID=K4A160_SETIT